MCSAFPRTRTSSLARRWAICVVLATAGLAFLKGAAEARELRVCSDPNNLPFSDDKGGGFENRLVELVARELDAQLVYTWWPQRRAYVRNTLDAGACDLVAGLPAGFERARTTPPYYRSAYAFVTRPGEPVVRSFDDPRLRDLKIGVQLVGDDGLNTPPAHALSRRGIVGVRGFSVFGDYGRAAPLAAIVEAVVAGEIDVAIAWGPLAGWAAALQQPPLVVTPVGQADDPPGLPMAFSIAMGVRRSDAALAAEVSEVLARRATEIDAILARWHVPTLHAEDVR